MVGMIAVEQLIRKTLQTVKGMKVDELGVAFSGGVDSSFLAKICKDLGIKVMLLTVGFSNTKDIVISKEVSKELSLPLAYLSIDLEDMEIGLRKVLSTIQFDRISLLENCVCFYFIFRLAAKYSLDYIVSANGIDELFCGYDVYRRRYGSEDELKLLMDSLVETARKDKEEIDKISALFNIRYLSPFLENEFVSFSMSIPLDLKIRGKDDYVRKHIWREAALHFGLPHTTAYRPKKAFQYSSRLHHSIQRMAKKRGFTMKKAQSKGYNSPMMAYIKSLKNPCARTGGSYCPEFT